MIATRCIAVAALMIATVAPAQAQLHAGDLILTVENQRVVVNAAPAGGSFGPERVFSDRFGKLGPSLPNRTPDPGFNAAPGSFVLGQPVGVTFRRAARVWTPSPTTPGAGDFCTIPPERLQLRKNGVTIETSAADPPNLAGPSLELGTTDPFDGLFHEHGVFWITSPFGTGVYLLELEVWVTQPGGTPGGVLPSEPVWIVFSQNAAVSEVNDAIAWLRASVAGAGGDLCPASCACDWNRSGALTVQDIFDYLAGYFGGAGDFNASGATTLQDILDFLACYFADCS